MADLTPQQFMPSDHQRKMWWRYVDAGAGADPDGNWIGRCPLHAPRSRSKFPSAWFNFRSGVLKCLGEPSCHEGQRAMSLNNVMYKMGGRRR